MILDEMASQGVRYRFTTLVEQPGVIPVRPPRRA